MVVESTLKVVTSHLYTMNVNSALTLQPSLNLVFSEIGQSEVEHSILMFTQFSTCIKQHKYTFKTIMQLSMVVQYMLWMYLDHDSSFLSSMYPSKRSAFSACSGRSNHLTSTQILSSLRTTLLE